MTDIHDEALIQRVAQALANEHCLVKGWTPVKIGVWAHCSEAAYRATARAAIYPPKTKLEVARELLAAQGIVFGEHRTGDSIPASMRAVIAALSLPAMED